MTPRHRGLRTFGQAAIGATIVAVTALVAFFAADRAPTTFEYLMLGGNYVVAVLGGLAAWLQNAREDGSAGYGQ